MKKVLFLCSLGSVFVHNVYKRKDPKRKQFASLLITLNNVCVKVCLGQLSVQPSCDTVLQPSCVSYYADLSTFSIWGKEERHQNIYREALTAVILFPALYLGIRKSALMGCMSQSGGWASAISMAVIPRLQRSLLVAINNGQCFKLTILVYLLCKRVFCLAKCNLLVLTQLHESKG